MRFVKADVSKWDELSAFFAFAKHYAGRIDQVYANAGYAQSSSIWDDVIDDDGKLVEPELTTMDVTLKGVIYSTYIFASHVLLTVVAAKLALHHFRNNPKPGGSLVFTLSTSSYNHRPNLPLYSISKYGGLGLLRALRSLGPAGNYHVAAVAPAATRTNVSIEC